MPDYIVQDPQKYIGLLVGTGQCVALVERSANMPVTRVWSKGRSIQGRSDITPGTIIATFDPNGKYGNHLDGSSHAAIYMGQDAGGIQVIDQWVDVRNGARLPHVAQPRTIHFRNGRGPAVNDGSRFYVVQ